MLKCTFDYTYIHDILYNMIYILYTIVSTLMIFLCSLRHFFQFFRGSDHSSRRFTSNPATGGLIYKFAATALNAAGESLQRKPYRMGDHQFIIYSESMAIFFEGIDEANIPQVMIIDSLLPNTIGTQSSVGTVDDDFPFPKGYVMVSWRVGKRSTLDIRHVGSRESAGNDEFVGRPKPWYLEEHHQRSHPGILF